MFFQEVQELGVLWVVASLPMGGTQSAAVLGAELGASSEVRTWQPRTCPGLPVAAGLQPGLGLVQPRGLPRLARHWGSDGLGTPGWQCPPSAARMNPEHSSSELAAFWGIHQHPTKRVWEELSSKNSQPAALVRAFPSWLLSARQLFLYYLFLLFP